MNMNRLRFGGILAAASLALVALPLTASAEPASTEDTNYTICTGPNLTGSCDYGQVSPGHYDNMSPAVASHAESYTAFGNTTLKLFTGQNGTGSGFSLVRDGHSHGLNNTKQWHTAYSIKGY